MAIKQIKIGNTIHDIQTTISNVEGLQAALDDKDVFFVDATPEGEFVDGIKLISVNKTFDDLVQAYVDEKIIYCRIIDTDILNLPLVGFGDEMALFGFSIGTTSIVATIFPTGEAALQNIDHDLSLFGVSASVEELNKLDGVTATTTELNYIDGVTSNIQTQLNGKVPTSRTINGKALSSNITLSASDIGAISTIKAAAGSNINTVGTPTVTASTSGTTTTFTFNNLKGATGAQGPKGDTGATGPQGPTGPKGDPGVNATTTAAATQSAAGLMSAADKKKLDGIATGANAYTLPNATTSVLGGVKIGSNITVSSGTISLSKTNVTSALGYTPPQQDTTYSLATATANGLMSKDFYLALTAAEVDEILIAADLKVVVTENN